MKRARASVPEATRAYIGMWDAPGFRWTSANRKALALEGSGSELCRHRRLRNGRATHALAQSLRDSKRGSAIRAIPCQAPFVRFFGSPASGDHRL